MSDPNLSSFIWSVADLLRGDYKQSEYGKVILPFTCCAGLIACWNPPNPPCWPSWPNARQAKVNPNRFLLRKAGQLFYNTSPLDLKKLMGDQDHIGENLRAYMQAFSPAVRDIFESFEFHTQIDKLESPACFISSRKSLPTLTSTPKPSAMPDGRGVRGTHPQIRRAFQRNRRGTLHPTRRHPAHGESPFH
jgi:hypothetical protein